MQCCLRRLWMQKSDRKKQNERIGNMALWKNCEYECVTSPTETVIVLIIVNTCLLMLSLSNVKRDSPDWIWGTWLRPLDLIIPHRFDPWTLASWNFQLHMNSVSWDWTRKKFGGNLHDVVLVSVFLVPSPLLQVLSWEPIPLSAPGSTICLLPSCVAQKLLCKSSNCNLKRLDL